ncbi:MAG: phytoene/squalene synthase family protein [Bryobacteraceae bacterium]
MARKRAKNFYYSFLLLEKPQRDAMCAVYAFMRHCDDLSDDPAAVDKEKLREAITQWRVELAHALEGEYGKNPIWPAFHDTVRRYRIPHRFFHEMIDGITSDLEPREIQTFDELYRYCYQVASVVGLTIIHIFGFTSIKALVLAEKCGVAFQLTNIIRDVREDAQLGRIYLPLEDLHRFSVPVDQLRVGDEDDRFRDFIRYEADRARRYYEESASLSELIQPDSRRSLWALRAIYQRLLSRIEAADYSVLSSRINVPTSSKLMLLGKAFLFPVA